MVISAAIGWLCANLFESRIILMSIIRISSIFYVLEEWAFQVQTFLQSFGLVVIALSWFPAQLLLNLLLYGVVATC